MQDATQKPHNSEPVGEPLRQAKFYLPLEHVTELAVLGGRKSSLAVDNLNVCGKRI